MANRRVSGELPFQQFKCARGFVALSYSSVLFFTKGQDMFFSFLFARHQTRLRSILGNKASNVTSTLSEARLDDFSFVFRFYKWPRSSGYELFKKHSSLFTVLYSDFPAITHVSSIYWYFHFNSSSFSTFLETTRVRFCFWSQSGS